jgi:Helix-turn-helix domain of resolvase
VSIDLDEDLDDSMPRCWWPEQRPVEKRPLPGWPRHRVGADRSIWVRRKREWRQLVPRILNGRPAVMLWFEGREFTRSVELLYRAAFSTWPERWIDRVGPKVALRTIPRPEPPPVESAPLIVAVPPVPAPIARPPAIADDDDGPRRYPRGSAHGRAKLDDRKVTEARLLHAAGFGVEFLMKRYPGVSRMALYYAITGKTWQHVPMPATNPKNLKRAEKSSPQRALDMHHGGMTAEAIAAELGISVRTVYRYVN